MELIDKQKAQDAFLGYDEYNFAYCVLEDVPTVRAYTTDEVIAILEKLSWGMKGKKVLTDGGYNYNTGYNQAITDSANIVKLMIVSLRGEADEGKGV